MRNQHIYIPGKTRHGKSTLFHAMSYQDIKNGAGVCVIDPKGDLVNSLIHWVPESRRDDAIWLSVRQPVPINFMDYRDDDEKETLVGELKFVITRGMGAEQAPLMDAIITDLLYTLLNANENPDLPAVDKATFLDIHRFLADENRRKQLLRYVTDHELRHRWETSFPNPKECAPTITRMTPFVRNPSLRKLFDCPKPTLNISEVMDNRKILLVDLGGISESTKIFATLLIAKIRQAAFRRTSIPQSKRVPFFVYVDEFEFFQTSDFDQILSFAGGYGLRLTLANQFVGQLDDRIRQSIFGNVGSFIVFCIGDQDIRHFKSIARPHDPERLAQLPKYTALYKIAGQGDPVIKAAPPPPPFAKDSHADYIRKRTLEIYGCKAAPWRHNPDSGKPDPEGTVLSHQKQAPGSPGSRGVFRPSESRSGRGFARQDPHPKRSPNDKPDP